MDMEDPRERRCSPAVEGTYARNARQEAIEILAESIWALMCTRTSCTDSAKGSAMESRIPSGSVSKRARPLGQKRGARGVPVQTMEEP
jgi:hypothetical protein